jgi:hypothetical protein
LAISTKKELQFLLHRGWEIEKKFESLAVWKAFVAVGSPYRKTILTLGEDSQKHRLALEKLLEAFNLEAPTPEMYEGSFDFTGKYDAEILREIAKQDEIAKDLYTELVEKTNPKLIEASSNKDVKLFYDMLAQIVKDEERHIKMVRNLAGHVKRV